MELQNPSQILKSEFRGVFQNEKYKCLSTFNYANYQEESRTSFGNLLVFNDETIAPKETINYEIIENQIVFLLPLVGAIEVNNNHSNAVVSIDHFQTFYIEKGKSFAITNLYESELINFLQIRFQSNIINASLEKFNFEKRNEIINVFKAEHFSISIGIFNARNEGFYKLKKDGVFAFVLNGAFEFQNRLLENRDGLKICNIQDVEFEALSENAILLIIEVSL
jgi:hypothetical protein